MDAAVESVDADQWQQPTPCSEWSVRDLVNHVVGEDLWTAPLLQGSTIEEVGDRFDGDLLGDDPVARVRAAAAEAVAAVADRLPRGGTVQLSYGEEQLDEYVLPAGRRPSRPRLGPGRGDSDRWSLRS